MSQLLLTLSCTVLLLQGLTRLRWWALQLVTSDKVKCLVFSLLYCSCLFVSWFTCVCAYRVFGNGRFVELFVCFCWLFVLSSCCWFVLQVLCGFLPHLCVVFYHTCCVVFFATLVVWFFCHTLFLAHVPTCLCHFSLA